MKKIALIVALSLVAFGCGDESEANGGNAGTGGGAGGEGGIGGIGGEGGEGGEGGTAPPSFLIAEGSGSTNLDLECTIFSPTLNMDIDVDVSVVLDVESDGLGDVQFDYLVTAANPVLDLLKNLATFEHLEISTSISQGTPESVMKPADPNAVGMTVAEFLVDPTLGILHFTSKSLESGVPTALESVTMPVAPDSDADVLFRPSGEFSLTLGVGLSTLDVTQEDCTVIGQGDDISLPTIDPTEA